MSRRHAAIVAAFALLLGFRPAAPSAGARRPDLPSDLTRTQIRVGFLQPGGRYVVQSIPIETYVARVLAGEAARDSRPAALEALAIAIRTFALANLSRHRADGFDLCDQTHCQVVRSATAATERAAAATTARVLVHDGAAATVYYSASCGGRTEIPSAVWPGAEDPPYLPSRPDDACEGAPAWTATLEAADLHRALRAAGFTGSRLREMSIARRDGSGRVGHLRLSGLTPDTISGQDLRVAVGRTLGWQLIKSTAFDLTRRGDTYRFSGHGSGHGVGLCVIGSARLAASGESADAILARYYPGLPIETLMPRLTATSTGVPTIGAPPGPRMSSVAPVPAPPPAKVTPGPLVNVSLPDEDEGEQQAMSALVVRARDAMAAALGVPPPSSVTVRVHPTTDSFEAATGQSAFTSGALVGGDVHLAPLAALRERGLLDRTIRRELVRQLTAAPLAKRPQWIRDGVALYYADQPDGAAARASARDTRVACPDDNELLRPVSVGALANAWARARACVARQVEQGKRWTEVR